MSAMINSGTDLQREVFDRPDKQYQQELILHPPAHTASETQIVVNKVRAYVNALNGPIIDFGAGTGRLTIPLLQAGLTVLPVDVSAASLDRLRLLAASLSLSLDQVSVTLPQNSQYTAVVGADILHHVPLDEYLPKIYKTLRPGGGIMFSEPGAFNLSWYLFVTLYVGWKAEKGLVTTNIPNLNTKLGKHGFKRIRITGLGLAPRPIFNRLPSLNPINDQIGNLSLLKLFAYRYIIEATK
jgi:SAM-dependent methyltransferase